MAGVALASGLLLVGSPAAQSAKAEFGAAIAEARRHYEGIATRAQGRSPLDNRAAFAMQAALDQAAALVDRLPPERRAQAAFWVEVWRTMLHWRLGDAVQAVVVGRRARTAAHEAGAYGTFYRAVLLIILWRSMPGDAFAAMLADPLGDADYLRADPPAPGALADLENRGWPEMERRVELLKADIDLAIRPKVAVSRLRRLAASLEPGELRRECYSRLAWHFIEMRDYDRAGIFLDEVPRPETRYPRALIAYKQEQFDAGVEEARALCAERRTASHLLLLANLLERQACVALEPEDRARFYGEAKQIYHETLRVHRTAPAAEQDPTVPGAVFNGLGDCHLGLGELAEAERALQRAASLLEGNPSWVAQAELGDVWKDQGRLAEARGERRVALTRYLAALERIEAVRRRIPLDRLGIAWLEKSFLEPVDGVLRLAAAGDATPEQALLSVDSMKARGVLDWMTSKPSSQNFQAFSEAVHALTMARSAAELEASRRKLESLRTSDAGARVATPLTAAELRALLDASPATVFVSYWVGKGLEDRRIHAVVARASGVAVHDLGSEVEGLQLYRGASAAVSDPRSAPWAALDAASAFFVPNAVQEAVAASDHVVVSVDSEIGRLPFEAFRCGGAPVGTQVSVYRSPSLAVYARLLQRRPDAARALILHSAEPETRHKELYGLSELQHSQVEAELVARWHGGGRTLGRADATLDNLRRELLAEHGIGLLHVSCHAIEDDGNPAASLLMLSSGPVDMFSLSTLLLRDKLVVFSNCSSAGLQSRGEGVKGLLWGALGGGARAVVASHWAMNQQATKDLMSQFHYHLARGAAEGEAMRRAREVLAKAENYAHPSYWAGFGVYGVPRAGRASPALGWWWLGGSVVGALILLGLYVRRSRATPKGAARGRP